MGYTGIPTAILFSQHYIVFGIQRATESGKRKIRLLNNRQLPFEYNEPELQGLLENASLYNTFQVTENFKEPISMSDLVTINIQTPVTKIVELHKLVDKIVPWMKDKAVLSIESTIPPGTVNAIKARWPGLSVVHAPERVNPGRLVWNIRNYDRIIGGDPTSVERARPFYQCLLDKGHIITMSAIESEITKTAENAVRDVQIAVSNQLALYCEELGANFYTIKNAIDGLAIPGSEINVSRAMLEPGAGVGGHCLTKDSLLLEHAVAHRPGIWPRSIFITAREINQFMPAHVVTLLNGYPGEINKIAVFGYAYKPDVDDDRESPAEVFYNLVKGKYTVKIHDPFCKNKLCSNNLAEVLSGANVAIIFTAHSEYLTSPLIQDPKTMKNACCTKEPLMVIDGRNVIKNPQLFVDKGIVFRGIGRGDLR